MSSQAYRGHVIEVRCYAVDGRIAYLSTIRIDATGALRQSEDSGPQSFASDSQAQDRAFSAARSWVDRYPLRWPFAVPAPGGAGT